MSPNRSMFSAEYRSASCRAFDLLPESERLELLKSDDPLVRAGAAHSFFNEELKPKVRAALFDLARLDGEASVRARAWESLADATTEGPIRAAMAAVLNDPSKPEVERGGAAVGLYGVADHEDIRPGIEALYRDGGRARAKALEAMWRSLWPEYARFFPDHLDDIRSGDCARGAARRGVFRADSAC